MPDDKSGLTIDTRPETHWPDCWRQVDHHDCAVKLIEWQWALIDKWQRARVAARETAATAEQHTCGSMGA